MNIEEYISSGIIESYVLGLASEEERAEFEKLCAIYPELVIERNRFEAALEKHALDNSTTAPPFINMQLLETISSPATSPDETIAFSRKAPLLSLKAIRYIAAACVIVLLGCGYFFYRLQIQNETLVNANKQLLARFNTTDSVLSSIVNAKKIFKSDNLSLVEMKNNAGGQASSANIYWDSASAAVYMVIKDLPPLPQTKQYQLWALIDGKPKDLGVFNATGKRVILKMKNCKKATAFSITVEPKGGNTSPSPNSVKITGTSGSL